MATICITHPDSAHVADLAPLVRQMFEAFGGSRWTVTFVDDPDFARVARGFTYAERQDDPGRAAEWLAATAARVALAPTPETAPS